jgi:hypothetical protein
MVSDQNALTGGNCPSPNVMLYRLNEASSGLPSASAKNGG